MKLIALVTELLNGNWPASAGGYYVQDGDDGFVKWSSQPFTEKASHSDLVWCLPRNWDKGSTLHMPDFRHQTITEDWKTTIITREMWLEYTGQKECACTHCQESIDYQYLMSKLSEEDQKILEKIYSELVHTRIDLNWHEAVMDGSWPNAEQHMLRAGWMKMED